jgi:predicted metalloprotease
LVFMTKVRSSDGSMIDDRRGRGGRGGGGRSGGGFPFPGMGGGGGGGGFPFPMKAGGGILGLIVVLAAVVLPQLLGAGGSTSSPSGGDAASTQSADAADGACNSEQEQVLCGATIDVQTYWQDALPRFFGTEYQVTQTVFFSGITDTGCGQASSQTGPFYCPLDNLVYFDLDFLVALEQQLVGKSTDLAQQYIVAHEYGHHVQNILGTNAEVQRAQRNDPDRANQYSVALELQADCYAGVWVGDIAARGLLDSRNEIQEALAAAEGVGDDRIQQKTQGRIDPESWTHGSAQQRQDWFMRGFNTRDPRQCDTFAEVL